MTMRSSLAIALFLCLSVIANGQPIAAPTGWEYRLGNSPIDANGMPEWATDTRPEGWMPLPGWGHWPEPTAGDSLWLRMRLPVVFPDRPAVFFDEIPSGMELFVTGHRITVANAFAPDQGNWHVEASRPQLLRLPADAAGRWLVARVWDRTSIRRSLSPPVFGLGADLRTDFLRRHFAYGVFAWLFLWVGLVALILTLYLNHRRALLILAALCTSYGCISLDRSGLLSLVFNSPFLCTLGSRLAMLTIGVGVPALLAELLPSFPLARWLTRLSRLNLAVAGIVTGLYVAHLVHPDVAMLWGVPLMLFNVAAMTVILTAAWWRGYREADLLLMMGLVPFGASAAAGAAASLAMTESLLPRALPIGFAVFLGALAVQVARRIVGALRVEVAARTLSHSEARFRALTENSTDMLFLLDAAGRFLFASRSCRPGIGLSPEELYGASLFDRVHGEDSSKLRARFRDVTDQREPSAVMEYRYQRADGEWRVHEARASNQLRNFDVRGVVLNVRDVTERRRDEQALREREAALRSIVDNLPFDFWALDADGRYTHLAATAIKSFGSVVGQQPDDMDVPVETKVLWREMNQRAFAGEVVTRETSHEINGKKRHVLNIIAPIHDGDSMRGILGVGIDVTERKLAEQRQQGLEARVLQSQKLESLGLLAGGVAHDFNNLLVGMLTNAGLALAELPPDSPTRPTVAEIEKSASHAADLCRQLLAYSGRGKYVVQPTDLNELVTTSRHLIDVSAAKNVSVEFRPGESLPPVEGDVTQLRQVLMNLVINASEAIGERGGTVTISTGCAECAADELVDTGLSPGSYVSLEVADTGCGMSEEVRKRIFEPFFSTKFTGRGLGLAAVVGIVRGHHGAITVSSREGEDSTFRVLLPACSRPAVPLAKPEPAPANWAGTGTVLVVDDDDSVRLVAQRFFEGAGFCVLSAASGASAVDVFRDRADDVRLVLLDLTMPGKSGEETFRELREVRPEVKVILTSGYSEQEMSDRFAANGPAGFVQKPWRPAELLDRVRTVLA